MAAYLEWRCHITLTTRSSPQSIISVHNKARGQSSPHLVTSLWNWSVVVEIGFLVLHDSDSSQTLKTFSVLNDWLDESGHWTIQFCSHKWIARELGKFSVMFMSVKLCVWVHLCALSCIYMCTVHASVCVMLSRRWCLSRGLCFQGSKSVKERSCQHGWYVQPALGTSRDAHPCQMSQH